MVKGKKDKFAIIATGGKQYKAAVGDVLSIEKLKSTKKSGHKAGDKVSFDKVLLLEDGGNTVVGTPYVKDAKVDAEITEVGRARKILVVKYKQKSRYLKRNGHRQPYFKVKITGIK